MQRMQTGMIYRRRTHSLCKLWLNWRRIATTLSFRSYDLHHRTDETCTPAPLCKESSSASCGSTSSQRSAANTERGGASPPPPPPAALQFAQTADPAPPPAGSPHSPAGGPRHAVHPVARGRSPSAQAGVRARLCASADPTEAGNSIALVAIVESTGRCAQLVLRRGEKIAASLLLEELNIIVAGNHMVELSVSGAELAVFLAFEDGASFDQFHHMVTR